MLPTQLASFHSFSPSIVRLTVLQVDRIVPVATREAMTQFGYLFAERSRKNLADGHLWFSVVARPPQSRFTCVQRVSCCLCLLAASMLANAMFYRTEKDTSGTTNGITLGPFSVSLEQVNVLRDSPPFCPLLPPSLHPPTHPSFHPS